MKKFIYSLFISLCAVFILAGCEKTNPEKEGNEYTVTFNANNGSENQTVTVKEGEKIAKPADPVNGEFIFAGWFKDAAWTTPWDFDKDVVTKDITLYAKWETVSFTVTFETNGGSAIAPVKVAKGSRVEKPLPPSKNDFAFENWYKEAALTSVYDFSTPVTSDITLYAKWASISRETLQTLVNDASQLSSSNFTQESFNAMQSKLEAARNVLSNTEATQAEVAAAYNELQTAINNLVKVQNKPAVGITIYNMIDNTIFVTPGQHASIPAYAVSADRDYATNKRVIFDYDNATLTSWADGDIFVDDNSLNFLAKSGLTAGSTLSLTVKSDENPSISKTVTLKIVGQGEVKTLFLNRVNALPAPDKISHEHYDELQSIQDLYSMLSNDDHNSQEVIAAQQKFNSCMDAYWDLPEKFKFSFKGNICTLTNIYGSESEEVGELVYVANGAFPAGTYTQNEWVKYDDKDKYFYQNRLILKSDGTGVSEDRKATDANGANATAWGDSTPLTYTVEGTQSAGGFFYIDFQDEIEKPEPGNKISMRLK